MKSTYAAGEINSPGKPIQLLCLHTGSLLIYTLTVTPKEKDSNIL
jgi:hypothetical protein